MSLWRRGEKKMTVHLGVSQKLDLFKCVHYDIFQFNFISGQVFPVISPEGSLNRFFLYAIHLVWEIKDWQYLQWIKISLYNKLMDKLIMQSCKYTYFYPMNRDVIAIITFVIFSIILMTSHMNINPFVRRKS